MSTAFKWILLRKDKDQSTVVRSIHNKNLKTRSIHREKKPTLAHIKSAMILGTWIKSRNILWSTRTDPHVHKEQASIDLNLITNFAWFSKGSKHWKSVGRIRCLLNSLHPNMLHVLQNCNDLLQQIKLWHNFENLLEFTWS